MTIDFDGINAAALANMRPFLDRLLPGGKIEGHEYIVRNPRRADRTAGSFKINIKTGRWSDFATGDKGSDPIDLAEFVLGGIGMGKAALEVADIVGFHLGKPNGKYRPPEPKQVVVKYFDYFGTDGKLEFRVERIEFQLPDGIFVLTADGKHKKSFRQCRPDPDQLGKWIYNVDGVKPCLYRQAEVLEAIERGQTVFVVEGERKVDLLWMWNIPATCNAGGAKKWRAEHAEILRGADVIILPDNDEPGREHRDVVGQSLVGTARKTLVLELPDLVEKGDIIDWGNIGHTPEDLWQLVETDARPWVLDDPKPSFKPTPFVWRDPAEFKRREWLYGNHYIRKYVTGTIGRRGGGKTTRAIVEILSMVTGRDLLGTGNMPTAPLRVWYIGEDTREEIELRFIAACAHHKIKPEEIGGRLFFDSVFDLPRGATKVAVLKGGVVSTNDAAIKSFKIGITRNGRSTCSCSIR